MFICCGNELEMNSLRLHVYGVLGALCVLIWVGLFVAGSVMTPDAETLRKELSAHFTLASFGLYCLLYLPANAALLTCLAGFVGGISSYLTASKSSIPSSVFRSEHPFASMLRSFVVYLVFVAGITVSAPENPFIDIKPGQYLRLAGLLSVLGFVVGYDPGAFKKILDGISWPRGNGPGHGRHPGG